jgi:transcriptional regulator with XRE-family HTH domain
MSKSIDARDFLSDYLADPTRERIHHEAEAELVLTEMFVRFRKEQGLTQADLAKRIGKTQPYVAKLEAGAFEKCSIGALRTFARALGRDLDFDRMFRVGDVSFSGGVSIDSRIDDDIRFAAVEELFSHAGWADLPNGAKRFFTQLDDSNEIDSSKSAESLAA